MIEAPKTKKELFARMLEIVRGGPYKMPTKRYSGTGAPGIYLEDLLGLSATNKDIPDSLGWELKYYTPKTNLITLFHEGTGTRGNHALHGQEIRTDRQAGTLEFPAYDSGEVRPV
jgi:hypothetical protein